jgi:hypothetical protein
MPATRLQNSRTASKKVHSSVRETIGKRDLLNSKRALLLLEYLLDSLQNSKQKSAQLCA